MAVNGCDLIDIDWTEALGGGVGFFPTSQFCFFPYARLVLDESSCGLVSTPAFSLDNHTALLSNVSPSMFDSGRRRQTSAPASSPIKNRLSTALLYCRAT